jgi:hypothetical protein
MWKHGRKSIEAKEERAAAKKATFIAEALGLVGPKGKKPAEEPSAPAIKIVVVKREPGDGTAEG